MVTNAEGIEKVRRAFADISEGVDLADVLAPTSSLALDLIGPATVWNMGTFPGWTDQAEWVGHAEVLRFMRMWTHPYDDYAVELEQVLEAPDGRVVAIATQRGRLRGAASWVALRFAAVYEFDGGEFARRVDIHSPEEGLRVAGLI